MRNLWLIFIALLFTINTSTAQEVKHHPFSGRWVLTAEGGLSIGKTDYLSTINSYAFNGLVEYFFPTRDQNIFGLRLAGGAANIKGKDERRVPNSPAEFSTDIQSLGLDLIYSYSINDVVFPYACAGASIAWFNPLASTGEKAPHNKEGLYSKNALSYDVEGGFRFRINDNWSILAAGGIHFVQSDYLDDVSPASQKTYYPYFDFPAGPHDDFYATGLIGISFSLSGERDSDGDGIPDSRDFCPNTPKGVLIDENGCPLDTDGDGVPDYLDKCPQTLRGVKVDKTGCPLDSDNDGVPDYLDNCPNTPAGIAVDRNGCPYDSDGDGVPDYLDKCPGTIPGTKVDSKGCPIDSDHDGVPDSVDRCPDTPIGVKVDQYGCEIKESLQSSKEKEKPVETAPSTRTNNTTITPVPSKPKENVTSISPGTSKILINADETFEPGTGKIKPSAYSNLDNIVNFLQKDPFIKWKINGYVDSQTTEGSKLSKSYEEADAIMKYFISKGLPSFQFQVFGLGDESPIAPNSTEEGRSKNRRVEIVKIK
jgi:outer membrane protein OmpA-like peptidoglycan-associated protein